MLRMTDIVERLRDWPNCTPVTCKEAADEIERLRDALNRIIADIHDYEQTNRLAPNPPRMECWDSVADARYLLERPR
jgi:hypothetical protein